MYKSVYRKKVYGQFDQKSKPLSKSTVRRILENLESLSAQEPSNSREEAIKNNKRKLAQMGIPTFRADHIRIRWCEAYLNDELETFEKWLKAQPLDLPIFRSVFSI